MLTEHQTAQLDLLSDNEPASNQFNPFDKVKSVTICGQELEVSPVFSAYWYFAAERQAIFFNRLNRFNRQDLTRDPILSTFKFTNAYRASDRVSQYLIKNVIYRNDLPQSRDELFFRIMLFKIFNKIETWELFERSFGTPSLSSFSVEQYSKLLCDAMLQGDRIYSAAYIMPSAGSVFGHKSKHANHLALLRWMLDQAMPSKLASFEMMAQGFHEILSVPSFGPFLAYQYITDLNYSQLTNFEESEFVVAGPGALDGISKCFTKTEKIPPEEIIQFMFDNQERYFDELNLEFQTLWGRKLQLIDCQNIFCEISKYARVAFPDVGGLAGRKRIKQKYRAGETLPEPFYPPDWDINSEIERTLLS